MRPGEIDPGAGVTRIGGDRLLENLDGLRGTPSGRAPLLLDPKKIEIVSRGNSVAACAALRRGRRS